MLIVHLKVSNSDDLKHCSLDPRTQTDGTLVDQKFFISFVLERRSSDVQPLPTTLACGDTPRSPSSFEGRGRGWGRSHNCQTSPDERMSQRTASNHL